ncbi:MAG TPA: hypothetical protein VNW54_07920, partial [Granulicella sp.]|nr:hypothetical protein [Granulicella sp.]
MAADFLAEALFATGFFMGTALRLASLAFAPESNPTQCNWACFLSATLAFLTASLATESTIQSKLAWPTEWRSASGAILPDPEDRDILVYLPRAYQAEPGRRFPVFYLHDGQNL